jgi:hypothetical protein
MDTEANAGRIESVDPGSVPFCPSVNTHPNATHAHSRRIHATTFGQIAACVRQHPDMVLLP